MQPLPFPLSSRAKPRDLRFRGPFVEMFSTECSGVKRSAVSSWGCPDYELLVIFWMVLVVLMPFTVGTISTRPPQVVISSAPTMVDVV
jgi:hypothetical protein